MKYQIIILLMLGFYKGFTDVNECLDTPCYHNATCEDTIHSYMCTCPCGYVGSGINCTRFSYPYYNDERILVRSKCAIIKDGLIATIPYVGKEYSVKFDLFPTIFQNGLSSVLSFNTHGDGGTIPAVHFRSVADPASLSNKLLVCSIVNDDKKCYYSEGPVFWKNHWTTVKISQTKLNGKYKYAIYFSGMMVYAVINDNAREFSNVKVYAGDPFHDAQPGFIRSLTFDTKRFRVVKPIKPVKPEDSEDKVRDAKSYLAAVIAGIVMFVTFFFMLRVYFRNKNNDRRVPRRTSNTIPMENVQTAAQVSTIERPVMNTDGTGPSNLQLQSSASLDALDPPPTYESFYPSEPGISSRGNVVSDELGPPPSYYSVYPVNHVTTSTVTALSNPAFVTD